ncbi:MAG: dihydrofolate synthase [Bacteroidetes bacterium GWA2_31_9]|nr:MAG: dihydrofolate synthase [Bacteroidetes bacterium GWA2_31_9]
MTYKKTLKYLFDSLPMFQRIGHTAYKADLNTTLLLDEYFKSPHKAFKSIHIAGTNGKGSTSHLLASIFQESGYKTGLYTSPHLVDFRERIRVNGKMISQKYVIDFVKNHKHYFETLKPSFFELTVALAFEYFKYKNIDIAIIETGMGGRLDSTNIVSPELSIITNIGLDHTAFLGNTLSDIAKEKAGIIKANIPVVVGKTQTETSSVFKAIAMEKKSDLTFADKIYKSEYSTLSLDNLQIFHIYKNKKQHYNNLKCPLLGSYQNENICTALVSVEQLIKQGFNISEENIYTGVKNVILNTGLQGRWQIINQLPLTICDTGHNEDGIKYITEQIKNTAYKKLHFIFGVVKDKNIAKILLLLPKDAIYYFTKASIPRALNENELYQKAIESKLCGKAFSSVEIAYKEAQINAEPNDLIFVGGSTFIVADFLNYINSKI